MAAVTICSDFGAPKIKSATASTSPPSTCHEALGLDTMILVFWMLSFKLAFSLSSFTLVKRLFMGFSGISIVKNSPGRHRFDPCVGKIPWRRKWQPTPAFLLRKSYSQRSLAGCSSWSLRRAEHDLMTKQQQPEALYFLFAFCH